MAIPQNELNECLRAVGALVEKRRPKPEFRDQVDLRADIEHSAVVISEVRPAFNDPTAKRQRPIAKATWVGTEKEWRLYWMRDDRKWHSYEADRPLNGIADVMDEIDRDPHGCFWG